MLFWQNWVGIALTLYLLKTAKNERFFVVTMLFFYLAYIALNAHQFGLNAGYIVSIKISDAVSTGSIVSLLNFSFVPLLVLSCLHLSDNASKKHKIRFYYIALTAIKSGLLSSYAVTLSNSNYYSYIISQVEYFWFIPDLLVLILGTTNPVTKRWIKN